jgi:glycosyltransferase involved in cell wall biosynthesis
VPARDVEALAAAIDALLRRPERRVELGARGRQRILDEFSWDVCAQQMVAYYRRVLDANR